VLALLARHGVGPARVVIELTEREAVDDIDRLVRCCSRAVIVIVSMAGD